MTSCYQAKPQLKSQGGGLAVVFRNCIKTVPIEFHAVEASEYLALEVVGSPSLLIILVHCPPKAQATFFSDLSDH